MIPFNIYSFFVITILVGVFYAVFIEPNSIKINTVTVKSKELERCFEGLKVIHFSDLHTSKMGYREKKVLKRINGIAPDIVFFTGDFGRQTKSVTFPLGFFEKIKTNHGIWAVPGNTDYYPAGKNINRCHIDDLLHQEEKLPFRLVRDKAIKLNLTGSPFYLVGIDDPECPGDYSFPKDGVRVERVLRKAKERLPKLVLAHQPDVFDLSVKHGVDLVLCGHTHGGQLTLPFKLNFFDKSEYAKKYPKGLYRQGKTYLYTTSGIGTTRLPMRFGARPEINIIHFSG